MRVSGATEAKNSGIEIAAENADLTEACDDLKCRVNCATVFTTLVDLATDLDFRLVFFGLDVLRFVAMFETRWMIQRVRVFGVEYTTYRINLFLVADFYRGVRIPSLK